MRQSLAASIGTLVLAALTAGLVLTSCERSPMTPERPPVRSIKPDSGHVLRYMDLCWPPSPDCVDRPLTIDEQHRVWQLSYNINSQGSTTCDYIRRWAMADAEASASSGVSQHVFVWTQGTPAYDPANYYGDRHNDPGITHITANALSSNVELMKTLIHEAAHGIGMTDDTEISQYEDECLGLYDI